MDAELQARMICNPAITSAQNIVSIAKLNAENDNDMLVIAQELKRQAEVIKSGDLSNIELSLWSSSVELSLLHTHLQKKALASLDNNTLMVSKPEIIEMLLNMALKIQIENRKTLTALAAIKNPKKATFIRQQLNQLNQLIQQKNGKEMDSRREGKAEITDSKMETLGTLDGSHHARRQAEILHE